MLELAQNSRPIAALAATRSLWGLQDKLQLQSVSNVDKKSLVDKSSMRKTT